jgi:hypothetical protein
MMPSKEQQEKTDKLKEEIRKTHRALSFTTNDDIVNAQRKMKRLKARENMGSEDDDDDKLLREAEEESDENRGRGRGKGRGKGKGSRKKRKGEEEEDESAGKHTTKSEEGGRKKALKIEPEEPSKRKRKTNKEEQAVNAEAAGLKEDAEEKKSEEGTPNPKKKKEPKAATLSPMQVAFKAAKRAGDQKKSKGETGDAVKRTIDFDEAADDDHDNHNSRKDDAPKRKQSEVTDTQLIFLFGV